MKAAARGFTLIELMVVVLIIGFLVTIGVPGFARIARRAKVASVKTNMHVVQVTTEDFASRNNGQYPNDSSATTIDGGLTFDQVLPAQTMPDNPFTLAPAVLDWSNARGTAPSTEPAGGLALNVTASQAGGAWDQYEVLAEDAHGLLLSLVLRND